MVPLIVLIGATVVFWFAGWLGVAMFHRASTVLRTALALMFLVTASAHWGKRRMDLTRMVPPVFPRPDLMVTMTGLLELLGVIGLLLPGTALAAAICLALLLFAMFPANVHAARQKLTIAGRPVPGVAVRMGIQIVILAALAATAVLKLRGS